MAGGSTHPRGPKGRLRSNGLRRTRPKLDDEKKTVSQRSLRELLEARAAATPEKVFLFSESDGRRFTFREFDAAVNRAANMLFRRGVGYGDVVSLLLPNSAEYVIAYFACFKMGALAGPVNSLLKSEEMAYVVGNSETKLLLYSAQFDAQVSELKGEVQMLRRSEERRVGKESGYRRR